MDLEKFEVVAETVPFGVCCYKRNDGEKFYAFIGANDDFFSCIGYERNYFEQETQITTRVLAPDERNEIRQQIARAEENCGTAYGGISEISSHDRETRHVKWSVKCYRAEEGMYLLIFCTNVDVLMKEQSLLRDKLNKEKYERRKLNNLIYEFPVGIVVVKGGRTYQIEVVNDKFLRAVGYTAAELSCEGKRLTECIYGEDIGIFETAMENCLEKKGLEEFEIRIITGEGQVKWVFFQCQLYYFKDAVPYFILASWDINERKELEDELKLLDEQYRMLEEVTDEFPFEYDVTQQRFRIPYKYHINGKISNPEEKYMEFEQALCDIYEEDKDAYRNAVYMASECETSGSIDYRLNVSPEGKHPSFIWYRTVFRSIRGNNGKVVRIIGRSYDISCDRKIQEQLSEEMRLDPLTRLLNKVATGEEVKRFISGNPAGKQVLFLIDIDNFKRINDTFGHTVGDTVILDIARLIKEHFRETDIVGRVGGDEFLVFMKNTTLEDAVEKARQLCSKNEKQLVGNDVVVGVTLSVGLAVYGVDGEDYNDLFEMADQAMYRTKRNGKNNFSLAKKGEKRNCEVDRKEKLVDAAFTQRQETDKEFLNFAFSLLSHARDINGSLNVLLEQIGKKYGLDMVSVLEYASEREEMTLTNYWYRFGAMEGKKYLRGEHKAFENAKPGEFLVIQQKEKNDENTEEISSLAGVKFEYAGEQVGCLLLGIRQMEKAFQEADKMTLCELSRVVGVFVALRNELIDDQKAIQNLQSRDKLTGLYNLETFKIKTKQILQQDNGESWIYALVHVDINKFSYVNENFGQRVGDNILQEFAKLLLKRETVEAACRMYSDYFVILVKSKSRAAIKENVLAGNELFESEQRIRYPAAGMRLSSGIYYIEDYNENFETILESANLARKHAKESGNLGVCVYSDGLRKKRDDEIQITGKFYGALQKGEIEVYLQPKFYLDKRTIYGAEALARWRMKTGEMMQPQKFIEPLENIGYIIDLDFYILEQLLRLMRKWKRAGKELFTVSTNFSRKNFENGGNDFIERLQKIMARYQIEPKYIEIEVTESAIVENLSGLKECLTILEQLGYRIAIDDFGTGYSSLSVLLEIPADVVKIDKKFTDRIDLREQREFVSQMGKFICAAKEEVIFEGIETEEQLTFLQECGFKYGQGYLIDKPLPVDEFERKYM